MAITKQFTYVDERTLRGDDGQLYDIPAAIAELGWVRQLCPFMPHEYAILAKGPEQSWFVVEAMIRRSPSSQRAYFRGYQTTNRYWDAPDGMRYWRGKFEIDRWHCTDSEGLRRRRDGAKPIEDWDGPPWAPNGAGYYLQSSNGRWWPSPKFFAEGYAPCNACRKLPPEIAENGVPAYVVADNKTLAAIAIRRPRSEAELLGVPGIGQHKVAGYGQEILEIVQCSLSGLCLGPLAERR